MAVETIQSLIDKQDNFEIIRDQIAAILVTEVANQVQLATDAGKPNPGDWSLKIYTERSDAWEQYLNENPDLTPIVNVWVDTLTIDASASNTVHQQKYNTVYNLDCYGAALSQSDGATGQIAGDKEGALTMQRAVRLVRNILMASQNTYLQLRGTVWTRTVRSVTMFQPEFNGQRVQNVVGSRISFAVEHHEISPQYEGDTLERVSIDVKRAEDGQVILEADYDYPL